MFDKQNICRLLLTVGILLSSTSLRAMSPLAESLKDAWAARPTQFATPTAGFEAWQKGLRERLAALIRAPEGAPEAKADVLWMIPEKPRNDWAVLCYGGSGQSVQTIRQLQGQFFYDRGFAVCCIANPPDDAARLLLEMGWSWLGYSVAAAKPALARLRTFAPRVIFSGFSLGTEPMMALGNLYGTKGDAYIYNDFLCRCKERLIVMDRDPNGVRYLTPGYFDAFDFPDLCVALSESPMIFTEGGLDRDVAVLKRWHPENITFYHQPKFAKSKRFCGKKLPRHVSPKTFFQYYNVDPHNHNYKTSLIEPWLRTLGVSNL